MSKKASPTVIGAFVVTAIVLLAGGVMIFGGAQLFESKSRLVAYFPDSVKGLRNGANVLFRGVRVGYVESIELQGDIDTEVTVVQVVMRVFPHLYKLTRDGKPVGALGTAPGSRNLIDAGLRAQLGVESFVTGQLVVEFDFYPDSKPVYHSKNPPYDEIPTMPNNIQQLVEKVQRFLADIQENLDIDKLAKEVQSTIEGLDELANSKDLREAIAAANRLLGSDATQRLPGALDSTLADARRTFDSVRELSANADADLEQVMGELKPAMKSLQGTLDAAEGALRAAENQLKGNSELAYRVNGTLAEVEAAARALRVFVDYLDRHPEALLRGKRKP